MNKEDYRLYFSERGIPLVYVGLPPGGGGVVTVENYLKWYSLYVVLPDGSVHQLEDVPNARNIGEQLAREACHTCDGDHTWHPGYVRQWASELGFDLDDRSHEILTARWDNDGVHGVERHPYKKHPAL